jgi:uncharacterized membrane protein
MMRLAKDFGVSALIAVMVIGGAIIGLTWGMLVGIIPAVAYIGVLSGWGGSAIGSYLTVKGVKQGQNGKENDNVASK